MSEDIPSLRRGSPAKLALVAFGGLALYILSPGPLGWLVYATGAGSSNLLEPVAPVIEWFFFPLEYLCRTVPFVAAFYEKYFALLGLT